MNSNYIVKYLKSKIFVRDLLFFIGLLTFSIFFMPYIFSWIHELSHAIVASITGFNVIGIDVFYPVGGNTTIRLKNPFLNKGEAIRFRAQLIAGSIGSVSSALILNRILYRKASFPVFLPLFIINGFWILYEFSYWFTGINYWMNDIYWINEELIRSDATVFLDITPQIDPILLKNKLIFYSIVILIWLALSLIKKIKIMIDEFFPPLSSASYGS